ncbi:MAG: LysR family transcriptional regulator [Myxococcota bacterium]
MDELPTSELLDGLTDFVAIVDAGSVSAAARTLDVPRATLSRRLSRLEDRLGVRLVHRTTRKLAPSPAGEELYRRAGLILAQAREAEEAIRRLDGVPRGRLRVSSVPIGQEMRIADLFLSFLERWPEVELELSSTPRHVDLVAEGFDCALRGGIVRDQGLVARTLRGSKVLAFASRGYLARWGMPETPLALADHACLRAFDAISARPVNRWPCLDGTSVRVSGRLVSSEMGLLLAATLRGDGIALMPEEVLLSLRPEQREDLVAVLPDAVGMKGRLSVVYPERQHLDPKVRAFVDHAVEYFAQVLGRVTA